MMQKHVVPVAVAAVLAATGLAAAQQQPAPADTAAASSGGFSLSAGVDYSTGKYGGTSSTDFVYVPITGKYEIDRWIFKLTVPYILVSGPGNVVRDIGIIKGKKAGPNRTQSGLGDVVAGVTRNVLELSTGTLVDLTGKVKFGTADAGKGLGTGENDYAPQVDVTQSVTKSASVFGSLGYKFVGNPPGGGLNNVVYGEVGGAYKLFAGLSTGVIFDASQAVSAVSGPQRELTGYIAQEFFQTVKLQGYVVHGFANGSPDWGGGAALTVKF